MTLNARMNSNQDKTYVLTKKIQDYKKGLNLQQDKSYIRRHMEPMFPVSVL